MQRDRSISKDTILTLSSRSDGADLESSVGFSTEEAQTLTLVSSPHTENDSEKEKSSLDAALFRGHYKLATAKESSFSVTTTSTVVPSVPRHFLPYPKDHAVVPIRILARQSVMGTVHVHIRLWRISSRLNKSEDMPPQFYEDLIELQRTSAYPALVTSKAWNILVRQITPSSTGIITEMLMLFPESVVIDILKKLAKLDDMATPWSTFTHYQPRFCLLFNRMLRHPRGLTLIHSTFKMSVMTSLLTERHLRGPSHPLHRFFDALLASTLPAIPEIFSTINRCELPPPVESFMQYLSLVRSPKNRKANLAELVDVIVSFIRPFADDSSLEDYFLAMYGTYPALRTTHRDDRGAMLHPALPFLQFASRLTFDTPEVTDSLIDAGVLGVISNLWLRGFPDPRDNYHSDADNRSSWPAIHRRNCMTIASLLLLGSMARHRPSVREFADHTLRMVNLSSNNLSELHWDMTTMETSVWDLRLKEFYPRGRIVKESRPSNSLPLFLTEVCVANGITLRDYRGTDSVHQLWKTIMGIIAIDDTTNHGTTDIKDVAVNILLSCASTPEEHWSPVLRTVLSMPYSRTLRAFQYIIQKFLRATADDVYDDWFELPADTITFLRRLDANAKFRQLKVANPIDRFIMMSRQITTNSPRHALALLDAGMSDLLRATLSGRYDKFFGDEDDRAASIQEDGSDVVSPRSSIYSPFSPFNRFLGQRLPVDLRAGLCHAMEQELKEASAKARSEARIPLHAHTSLQARRIRPLPKIPTSEALERA